MQSTAPSVWVERLFFRLQVRYGQEWNRMWEGIEPDAVKADWEETLRDVFTRKASAITFALEHLPERVPTADVFLKLCWQAPSTVPARPAAPTEPGDPKRIEAALSKMQESRAALQSKCMAQQCIDNIETSVRNRGGKIGSAQKSLIAFCLRKPNTSTKLGIEVAP